MFNGSTHKSPCITHVLALPPGLEHGPLQPEPRGLDVDVVQLPVGVHVVQVEVRVQRHQPQPPVVQLDRVVAA